MADDDIGIYDDLIGGELLTRFKYRMVQPNDFGLTDEEVLFADDAELNRWCSLKKMSQFRSNEEETYDLKVYSQKAKNMELKKKILKSIYGDKPQSAEEEKVQYGERNEKSTDPVVDGPRTINAEESLKKKRGKKRRNKKANKTNSDIIETTTLSRNVTQKPRKRKRNSKSTSNRSEGEDVAIQRLKAYGMSKREIKKLKISK